MWTDPDQINDHNSSEWWPFGGLPIDWDAHRGFSNANGRSEVPSELAAERNHVIVLPTNSNGANFVQGLYTPTHAKVHQINVYDGAVYQLKDPVLGASSASRVAKYGSVWGEVGDRLINDNLTDRLIFVPIGIGSSDFARWIPGGVFHQRVLIAIRHMIRLGYMPGAPNVTKVFMNFSAAVTDCLLTTTQQQWEDWFGQFYDAVVAEGLTPDKTFVSTESKTTWGYVDVNRVAIRAAQIAVRNGTNIIAGADIDAIPDSLRYDGAHMTAPGGRQALALAWKNVYAPHM